MFCTACSAALQLGFCRSCHSSNSSFGVKPAEPKHPVNGEATTLRLKSRAFVRLRAILVLPVLLLALVHIPSAEAAGCTKVNQVRVTSGTKFVCKKVGTRLVWQKQRATVAAVAPRPTAPRPVTAAPAPAVANVVEWTSCKKSGQTAGAGALRFTCVPVFSQLTWILNTTLDTPTSLGPCRKVGAQAEVGGILFTCERGEGGNVWDRAPEPEPEKVSRVVSGGIGAGHCSVHEEALSSTPVTMSSIKVERIVPPSSGVAWCLIEVQGSTSIRMPANLGKNSGRVNLIAVGGGGGGGSDGGSGGSGGEVRFGSQLPVDSLSTVEITLGTGGRGGVWGSQTTTAGNGGATSLFGGGLNVFAEGGTGGGTWGTRTPNISGRTGNGLTALRGGAGGYDPTSATAPCTSLPWSPPVNGVAGPTLEIFTGRTLTLAGGGGSGWWYRPSLNTDFLGSLGGFGGGGRGASFFIRSADRQEAGSGGPGQPWTGGGGGAGAACDPPGAINGISKRTQGGSGGSGAVFIAYQPQRATLLSQEFLRIPRTLAALPDIRIALPLAYRTDGDTVAQVRASAGSDLRGILFSASGGQITISGLNYEPRDVPAGSRVTFTIDIPGFESLTFVGEVG